MRLDILGMLILLIFLLCGTCAQETDDAQVKERYESEDMSGAGVDDASNEEGGDGGAESRYEMEELDKDDARNTSMEGDTKSVILINPSRLYDRVKELHDMLAHHRLYYDLLSRQDFHVIVDEVTRLPQYFSDLPFHDATLAPDSREAQPFDSYYVKEKDKVPVNPSLFKSVYKLHQQLSQAEPLVHSAASALQEVIPQYHLDEDAAMDMIHELLPQPGVQMEVADLGPLTTPPTNSSSSLSVNPHSSEHRNDTSTSSQSSIPVTNSPITNPQATPMPIESTVSISPFGVPIGDEKPVETIASSGSSVNRNEIIHEISESLSNQINMTQNKTDLPSGNASDSKPLNPTSSQIRGNSGMKDIQEISPSTFWWRPPFGNIPVGLLPLHNNRTQSTSDATTQRPLPITDWVVNPDESEPFDDDLLKTNEQTNPGEEQEKLSFTQTKTVNIIETSPLHLGNYFSLRHPPQRGFLVPVDEDFTPKPSSTGFALHNVPTLNDMSSEYGQQISLIRTPTLSVQLQETPSEPLKVQPLLTVKDSLFHPSLFSMHAPVAYQAQAPIRGRAENSPPNIEVSLDISKIPGAVLVSTEGQEVQESVPEAASRSTLRPPPRRPALRPRPRPDANNSIRQSIGNNLRPRPNRPFFRPIPSRTSSNNPLGFPRRPTTTTPPPPQAIDRLSLLMSQGGTTVPPITSTTRSGPTRQQLQDALQLLVALQENFNEESTSRPPATQSPVSASIINLPNPQSSGTGFQVSLSQRVSGQNQQFEASVGEPVYPPAPPPLPGPPGPIPVPSGVLTGAPNPGITNRPGAPAPNPYPGYRPGSFSPFTHGYPVGQSAGAAPGSVSVGGGGGAPANPSPPAAPQQSVVSAPAPPPRDPAPPAPSSTRAPPFSISFGTGSTTTEAPAVSQEEYNHVISALHTLMSYLNRTTTQSRGRGTPGPNILYYPVPTSRPRTTTSRPIARPFLHHLDILLARPAGPRPPAPPPRAPGVSLPQNLPYGGHIGQGQHGQLEAVRPSTTAAPSPFSVSVDVYVPILSELLSGGSTTPSPAAAVTQPVLVFRPQPRPGPLGAGGVSRRPQGQTIQELIQQATTTTPRPRRGGIAGLLQNIFRRNSETTTTPRTVPPKTFTSSPTLRPCQALGPSNNSRARIRIRRPRHPVLSAAVGNGSIYFRL
ncbi:hypothetical protein C7M84_018739 [Penaeus vannamei]|uniref:Uncharacterized protein n=1 Tax=Penaeus vannamei TaxID=6689 RepID=A0A423SGT8_PENVA|nr:hypothetical protein C7M84_018739 [Penaeus vannamei]